MTRTVFYAVSCCVALAVAAMVSILARDVAPAVATATQPVAATMPVGPSPNVEGKRDKLAVSIAPPDVVPDRAQHQAYAADSPFDAPVAPMAGPVPMPRPRAGRTPAQKNYTLISDMQIAAIKGRLKLTPAQQPYWPDVENALRTVAASMHDKRQAVAGAVPSLEAGSTEVARLRTAAQPLLAQLREDQKRDLRELARLIGLEAIAAQI